MEEFTVREINTVIEGVFRKSFGFICVVGELFQVSHSRKGHIYMVLKEDNSLLKAVCWSSTNLSFVPVEGMVVQCVGYITVYQSYYQLITEDLRLSSSIGNLGIILKERKVRLATEGLFDESAKKELPFLPNSIGLITSKDGAVLHDIVETIRNRFPIEIVLWPVAVQGAEAVDNISKAIIGFNNMYEQQGYPNVLIVARGGGSIEDLWSFNEEEILYSVFESKIPIISAIGHETDTMLIDYVADYRASTPTAAAERVVPLISNLYEQLINLLYRLNNTINDKLFLLKMHCNTLHFVNPLYVINQLHYRLDGLQLNISARHEAILKHWRLKVQALAKIFSFLENGYAVVSNGVNGIIIRKSADVFIGEELQISWIDGSVKTAVIKGQ